MKDIGGGAIERDAADIRFEGRGNIKRTRCKIPIKKLHCPVCISQSNNENVAIIFAPSQPVGTSVSSRPL
jgi:hypothetical protein